MPQGITTLIVDPNLDSRLDLSRVVQSIGLEIAGETAYGTEATFVASQQSPDVILLSMEDPPMRALATLEALQEQFPDIPVLVYSTLVEPSLMRQAMRAGARDFLGKPFSDGELRGAVFTVLSHEEQRQLARSSEALVAGVRGTVITVTGAKGGIGKTTFSTNLATLMREMTGQDVALVDCDAQFGDVAVMLDVQVQLSIADLARNEREITRHTIVPYLVRNDLGLDLLLAASEPDDWRALQAEHISAIAHALAESHEYVIIDTPGVMNDVVAAAINAADIVLLVTSLDVSSVKDTKTAVDIFKAWGIAQDRIRLFINDSSHADAVRVEDVESATGLRVQNLIPFDGGVGISVQTGTPLVVSQPKGRFARAVREVAAGLTGIRLAPRRSILPRWPLIGR